MNIAFDEKLAALRQRFLSRAAENSASLESIAADLQDGAHGDKWQAEIRQIAHRLAGGGGTFGFGAVSACAAELEEFVAELPNSPELADACRALAAEIRRSVQSG